MTTWKAGMRALCIQSTSTVTKGRIYDVVGVYTCCCVNLELAGVNLNQMSCGTRCIDCDHKFWGRKVITSQWFRPVDDLLETLERIEEEVERDGVPLEEPELIEI